MARRLMQQNIAGIIRRNQQHYSTPPLKVGHVEVKAMCRRLPFY